MNAPLPDAVRKALETVTLDDKYSLDAGPRLHERRAGAGAAAHAAAPARRGAGLNTAGFISGYRGSPLGGYDQALWAAKKHLAAQPHRVPARRERRTGATAVWGTQQLDLYPQSKKYDGVFGIWYGKGPGVDRCSDVFKHANMAGTSGTAA
jgi:indolepyruvate ferredoxin oxidoreductase